MILLDEFPLQSLLNSKGEVDARVFPNFARLAERSNWYRNATGVSGFTQYAVPAVLSGQYPKAKLAPSYVQHPNNIFSLLAPDYRIRASRRSPSSATPRCATRPTSRAGATAE